MDMFDHEQHLLEVHLMEIAKNYREASGAYQSALEEWIQAGDAEKRAQDAVYSASKKRDMAKAALDAAEECLLIAAGGKPTKKKS